jgi:hypothetical protein
MFISPVDVDLAAARAFLPIPVQLRGEDVAALENIVPRRFDRMGVWHGASAS